MTETDSPWGPSDMDSLVLRALVRKLMTKGLLSEDDVRTLLLDAAKDVDVGGGPLTIQAARDIVAEELAPQYLGS